MLTAVFVAAALGSPLTVGLCHEVLRDLDLDIRTGNPILALRGPIAEAPIEALLDATIQERDDRRVLARTAQQASALRQADRADLAVRFAQAFDLARERLRAATGPAAIATDFERSLDAAARTAEDRTFVGPVLNPEIRAPIDVLLDRMLIELGPNGLAGLPLHKPHVYALKPNGRQSRMAGLERAVDEYQEAERYVALTALRADPRWERAMASARSEDGAEQALFTVVPMEQRAFVQVAVYGRSGARRALAGRTLNADAAKVQDPDPRWIDLSPQWSARLALFPVMKPGFDLAAQTRPKADGEWWAGEPLEWAMSDALQDLSVRRGKPVAAVLSDRLFDLALECVDGTRLDVAKLFDRAGRNGILEWTVVSGWLVGKPKNPAREERTRIDRPALARLLASSTKRGHIDLSDYCAFWRACGAAPADATLDDQFLATAGAAGVQLSHVRWWRYMAYRALGAMPETVRKRLWAGEAVPLSALGADARALLDDWSCYSCAEMERAPGATVADRFLAGTEAAPGRFPGDAVVRLVRPTVAVLRSLDGPARLRQDFAVEDLASVVFQRSDLAGRWALSSREDAEFIVELGTGARLAARSRGPVGATPREYPSWDALPEEVRAPVDRRLRRPQASPGP